MTHDDSTATTEADGLTRAGLLRLLGTSAAACAGLELLGAPGALAASTGASTNRGTSKAAAHRNEITTLQYLLTLEQLGQTFYQDALHELRLDSDVKTMVTALRAHERAHAQSVAANVRSLGGTPHPAPTFDFSRAFASQDAFLKTSATLEQLCVETMNGAITRVHSPVIGWIAAIVSVEARHASWVQSLRMQNPAPAATTPGISAATSTRRANALRLTTKKLT